MINFLSKTFGALGEYITLIVRTIVVTIRRPPQWHLISHHLYNIGVLSLPVVAITGFSTGSVLAVQSFFQLADKGLSGATGLMVTKAMMVELGPILTAFMVTGRVGSAMCAEIGSMKVTEQIDAMRSMAVNPLRHLISPRFIAGMVMMPLLSVFSCIMGVLGGFVISVYHFGMSPENFMDPPPIHIIPFDFISGLIKAFIFGVFIVTISCYKGFTTS
ncbi:MAG: ABC transporter permease, partial [Waddliaceae bacterium]|nr:ABC transporter permease [Waddliaceae bacterium]